MPENSDVSIEVKNLPAELEDLIRIESKIQYFGATTNKSELANLEISDTIDNNLPTQKRTTISITDKTDFWLISAKVFFKKDNQWTAVNSKTIRSYKVGSNDLNIHFDNGFLLKEGEDLKVTLKNFTTANFRALRVNFYNQDEDNFDVYYLIEKDGSAK